MAALADSATPGLVARGLGPARTLPSGKYIPIRWPTSLWFRQFTQNDDLHVFVYEDRIAIRVHIDAFPGDRAANNAALDLVRSEVEPELLTELLTELPNRPELDWRAAVGGDNQVCAITRSGGVRRNDVDVDAEWTLAVAGAWLTVLFRHPIPDLRAQVRARRQPASIPRQP